MILVNRVLTLRTLQPHGDYLVRLIDFIVVAKGLKAGSDYLDAKGTVRNSVKVGLAFVVGFQLEAAFGLLAMFSHGMQNHGSIADGLSTLIFEHYECQRGLRSFVLVAGEQWERGDKRR